MINGNRQETIYKSLRGHIGYRRPDYFHKNRDEGFLSQLLSQARKIIGNDQGMMAVVKTGAGIDSKKEGYTHIYSSTPGSMGLAAMLTAKILGLPHYSTYNAAFPQLAERLTTDHNISELVWKFIVWFYNHTERVFVSSYTTGKALEEKGIRKELIRKSPWTSVEKLTFESLYPKDWAYYDAAA